jgi:hypothetical protein
MGRRLPPVEVANESDPLSLRRMAEEMSAKTTSPWFAECQVRQKIIVSRRPGTSTLIQNALR